jgi:hypothetical protein
MKISQPVVGWRIEWTHGTVALLLCLLLSCTSEKTEGAGNQRDTAQLAPHSSGDRRTVAEVRRPPCDILDSLALRWNDVIRNPSFILRGDDECVLAILDSVTNRAIADTSGIYMAVLDSVCKVSDGYISEYLQHALVNVFKASPRNLIDYMYERRKDTSCIEVFFASTIAQELSYPDAAILRKETFFQTMTELQGDATDDERSYMSGLLRRVNAGLRKSK